MSYSTLLSRIITNCGPRDDLRVPWTTRRSNYFSSKGNQPWIFIGRTDAEAEAAILWPPDSKSWLIGKVPDAGKDWGQEETGATEDEIVGWHHWLNGHEFEQTPGDSEGQESLPCCSPWGCNEPDTTERLNNKPMGWIAIKHPRPLQNLGSCHTSPRSLCRDTEIIILDQAFMEKRGRQPDKHLLPQQHDAFLPESGKRKSGDRILAQDWRYVFAPGLRTPGIK